MASKEWSNSNAGSQPAVLFRVAKKTAALSKLKIIWKDKNILLVSKVKPMRTLILSTIFYACESWSLTAELEKRIQALEMRCYSRLLFPRKTMWWTMTFAALPWCNWSAWWSPIHGEEIETQMVWPHLKILWHDKDNSVGDSERSKKERNRRRDGKIPSKNGQEWSLEIPRGQQQTR